MYNCGSVAENHMKIKNLKTIDKFVDKNKKFRTPY